MAAEVLNILITYNDKVTGITVNGFEFKLYQIADDTTSILDRSSQSIESALDILEIFGTLWIKSKFRQNKNCLDW